MKNIDTVLGLLLSVMASIPAFATSPVEERHDALVNDHKIVFFGGGQDPETDSIRNLIENSGTSHRVSVSAVNSISANVRISTERTGGDAEPDCSRSSLSKK